MIVICDNIYPATQFHFRSDHTLSDREKRDIIEALKIPMAGLVTATVPETLETCSAISFAGSRIIVTTAHNKSVDDTDAFRDTFMEAIQKAETTAKEKRRKAELSFDADDASIR